MKQPLTLEYIRYCDDSIVIESFLIIPESPLALSERSERFGERGREKGAFVLPCLENSKCTFPDGDYPLRLTWSNKFGKPMPEICHVTGRSGMRIHLARYAEQLRGCIGLRYDSTEEYNTQRTTLEYIKKLCQSYEITLSIHTIPLRSSVSDLFDSAGHVSALVRRFATDCHGSLAEFIDRFYRIAIYADGIDRLDSEEHLAHRAILERLQASFLQPLSPSAR